MAVEMTILGTHQSPVTPIFKVLKTKYTLIRK